MVIEKTNTLVVGAGQAGLAASEHLSSQGISHVVLERHRIAERWRSERWDSLVANGPAWHDRFPSMEFSDLDPDSFATKDRIADYFAAYAEQINAPVRCGVEVLEARQIKGAVGYHIKTSAGEIEAQNIIVATGPFQEPIIPAVIPEGAGIHQIHSSAYKNPAQLPDGAVLVVGAGSSGAQIADELLHAGRDVFLSIGPHDRPPRSYRGRDFVWWLGVLGKWDAAAPSAGAEHVTISVSGAHGGHTVDFRRLADNGIFLLGMTEKYENGEITFAQDLAENLALGDANYLSVLDEADQYISRYGFDLPQEEDAREIGPDPDCVTNPVLAINLEKENINSIIWATGFSLDYGWLKVDTFDKNGRPNHHRGVSSCPGIYFIGLPWLSRRGSSFIWGVWHDAKYLAGHIATQRSYFEYNSNKKPDLEKLYAAQ